MEVNLFFIWIVLDFFSLDVYWLMIFLGFVNWMYLFFSAVIIGSASVNTGLRCLQQVVCHIWSIYVLITAVTFSNNADCDMTVFSTDGRNLPSPIIVTVPKCGRLKDLIGALSIAFSLRDDEMLMVVEVCCVLWGFQCMGNYLLLSKALVLNIIRKKLFWTYNLWRLFLFK